MNYRQWKKNYKKKHGYNPPISEDKRKRNKQLVQTFPVFFDEFIPDLLNGIANACELISNSFANAAESFKTSANSFSRKGY